MRRWIMGAMLVMAMLVPAAALGASGYLHVSEARSMQTRLAARMDTKLNATDVRKGQCVRVDAHHMNCPVTYHRYNDGVYESCPYTVKVVKRRAGSGTVTNGRIDGYCGQA